LNADGKFIRVSVLKTLKIANPPVVSTIPLTNRFSEDHASGYITSNVTETHDGLSPGPAQSSALGSSKMAGQIRVLQLDAEQELETKLYRLEKGKVLLLEQPKVLVQVSELDISLLFPP